jgi:hypothetical protein
MTAVKWKTVRIRQKDHDLLIQIQEDLRRMGHDGLPPAAQAELAEGAAAGAIVTAGLTLLRKGLDDAAAKTRGKRR